MIKNRKEMYAYIRQDMKRNLMCGGGKYWIKILLNPRVYHHYSVRF